MNIVYHTQTYANVRIHLLKWTYANITNYALYLVSVLDRATVGCFLLLHATTTLLRENMNLDVDRRSAASPP